MDTGAFAAVLLAPVVVLVALGIAVAAAMAVVLTAWGLSSIATRAIIDAVRRRRARSADRLQEGRTSGVDGSGVVDLAIDDVFPDGARDVR